MPTPATSAINARTSTRTYAGTRENVRAIRADLRALLAGCAHADDIILCASELAANAAIHSNSAAPGGTITVHAEIRYGNHVRIEISDDGGPWSEPAADPDRPHGLDVIAILATAWGITDTPSGRTAWAQLDWPAR